VDVAAEVTTADMMAIEALVIEALAGEVMMALEAIAGETPMATLAGRRDALAD